VGLEMSFQFLRKIQHFNFTPFVPKLVHLKIFSTEFDAKNNSNGIFDHTFQEFGN